MANAQVRPIRSILTATGLTSESSGGLLLAAQLSRKLKAPLHAAHVVTTISKAHERAFPGIAKKQEAVAAEELERFATSHNFDGPRSSLHVLTGDLMKALTELRYDLKSDLLVIGKFGKGGPKPGGIGSIATRIVRKFPVSVLVVPPDFRDKLDTIGVATNLSEDGDWGVVRAAMLAKSLGIKEITLFHTFTVPAGYDHFCPWDQAVEKMRAVAVEDLEDMKKRLKDKLPPDVAINAVIVEGAATDKIPALAEEHKIDILVISTHARASAVLSLLGHTSEQLIRSSNCCIWCERNPSLFQGWFDGIKHLFD
ncbi:MAG: universal stress protein [Phycisphaeraceae bacterium]|nr:universal stress protein [Phycisphaerales bacterium]MCB9859058.1 universal stress protein [Phycisphaeraceae bacterium]